MIKEQQELAALLGGQLSPDWREAFAAVPRHLFAPDRVWRMGSPSTPIDRQSDPDAWMAAVYSDDIVVTQHDENGHPSSSCSMPYMVFGMLNYLDVHDGHKVMDIGTGTGWTAALLSSRLGADHVVSIEIDADAASGAATRLAAIDCHPTLVVGDGALGYELGAPYDRVQGTCAVDEIPYAWVAQTRPGGVILTPWGNTVVNPALLRLTVNEDGTATGKVIDFASFMWMRSQRPRVRFPDEPDDFAERAEVSHTAVDVEEAFSTEVAFTAGVLVPRCRASLDREDDGSVSARWLLGADSWASVQVADGTVRQYGPRRLWNEYEAAYAWWLDHDRPELTRFGVTVTRDSQRVWLDDPANVLDGGTPEGVRV